MGSREEPAKVESPRATGIDFDGLASVLDPLGYARRLELLHFLTEPHYLEEVASHLGMSRQAARKHVAKLLEIGVIEKRQGERESGPVVEYVVVPQRLFALSEEFSQLGVLRPTIERESFSRTEVLTSVGSRDGAGDGVRLVIAHGLEQGRSFPLLSGQEPWSIGRDPERAVAIEYDPFVSTQHAKIERRDGELVLVDTYSTNGSFVNFERLPEGGWTPLEAGDIIRVGKTLLVVQS